MREERRFQELLSELTTRESSTLVVATVASSASLVLLGFSAENKNILTYLAGVFFPFAGFVYREVTIFSIDRKDYFQLIDLVRVPRPLPSKLGFLSRQLRRGLLRVLFPIPSLIWLSEKSYTVVIGPWELPIPIISLSSSGPFILVVVVALCYLEWHYKDVRGRDKAARFEPLEFP